MLWIMHRAIYACRCSCSLVILARVLILLLTCATIWLYSLYLNCILHTILLSYNPPVPSLDYLSREHDTGDWLHLFKEPNFHSSYFQLLAVHPTLYAIKSLYPAVEDIRSQMTLLAGDITCRYDFTSTR